VIDPDAPLSPYIHPRANTPKGELKQLTFNSKFMGEERRVVVYTPAAYNADVAHNLVIQFDGQNYARSPEHGAAWEGWSPMPTILDNLIHDKKIAPTITLFIQNQGNRSGDLLSAKMSDFVALELVDWARKNYNISKSTANVVVSGPSRGGFAAASTALRHSNLIGAVLSQSGSFYYRLQDEENWPVYPEFEGQLLLDYKHSAKRDIRFYLDVGLYDLGLGAVGTNRQLRDILDLKGYRVTYYQYKGGHSHLGWRHTLANGLISLLGEHQK
jgi:enterochelin esterase-like enzyme